MTNFGAQRHQLKNHDTEIPFAAFWPVCVCNRVCVCCFVATATFKIHSYISLSLFLRLLTNVGHFLNLRNKLIPFCKREKKNRDGYATKTSCKKQNLCWKHNETDTFIL